MSSDSSAFDPCPCGGTTYASCCGPLHDGEAAATAEALMRSRYSAYATGRTDYLYRTWHPRTRPEEIGPQPEGAWVGLEIVRAERGGVLDETGIVEFKALFRDGGHVHVMREVSTFERRGSRWVYVDGQLTRGGRRG